MSKYPLVMRAYPADYRKVHGDEIAATAAELGGGRWSLRQSRSLMANGLRTRCRLATGASAKNAWGQSILTAIGLTVMVNFAFMANGRPLSRSMERAVDFDPSRLFDFPIQMAIYVVVVGLLAVRLRWWSIVIIGALNGVPMLFVERPGFEGLPFVGSAVVVLALMLVLRQTEVTRAFGVRPALLMATISAIAAASVSMPALNMVLSIVLVFVLPITGLLFLTIDPRPFLVAIGYWVLLLVRVGSIWAADPNDGVRLGYIATVSVIVCVAIALSIYGTRRFTRPI